MRIGMRLLPALLFGALLGTGVNACGGAHQAAKATTGSSSAAATAESTTSTTTSVIPPGQVVRGDGDADNPSDIDGNGDSDAAVLGGPDTDKDNPTPQGYRFPDSDDRASFLYGHQPSAAAERAIEGIVTRYYRAASVGNGATACALLLPSLARSVPESYGGPSAPTYLRGAKTCSAALSDLFEHSHQELAATVEVFAVRVAGNAAHAIFSSRTLRAGEITLTRQKGAWALVEVLGNPLP
jgi:hypothetical protein